VQEEASARAGLQAERDRLQQERDQLQAQLGQLNEQVEALQRDARGSEALALVQAQIADSLTKAVPTPKELEEGIRQRQLKDSASRGIVLSSIAGTDDQTLLEGGRIRLPAGVLFESGSAELSEGGKQTLAEFARRMRRTIDEMPPMASWMLRIDGHTDDVPLRAGSRWRDNLELSTDRAAAVAQYLIDSGLPPERVVPAGFGSSRPAVAGNDAEARAQNRRIEITLSSG
jgi:chemotaxis protein MotB